jgi:hypothetical protein
MPKGSIRGVLQLLAEGALGIFWLATAVSRWIVRLMWNELAPGDSEFVRRANYKPSRASETAEEYRRTCPRGRFYTSLRVCYWVSWVAFGVAVLCVPLYFVVE